MRSEDNALAHTGLASLAAARHDFAGALSEAQLAQTLNPYSAVNLGVLGDALVELGRYEEAFAAFQRGNDLKPGVPTFARTSYAYELRGDTASARFALERALEIAYTPGDKAFAEYYLGELAWNAGDLDGAARHYAAGLKEDDAYLPLLAGRAKVQAAQGGDAGGARRLRAGRPAAATAVLRYRLRRPAGRAR